MLLIFLKSHVLHLLQSDLVFVFRSFYLIILIPSNFGFFLISSFIETSSDFDFFAFSNTAIENDKAAILTFFVNSPLDKTFPGMTTVSPSFVCLSILSKFTAENNLVELERIFATGCHSEFFTA